MSETWDKIGIEIEYVDVDPKQDAGLRNLLEVCGYKITHDASVESPTITLGGCPVKGATFDREINDAIFRKSVIGGELVSSILDTSTKDWIVDISNIFKRLKNLGERVETNRGSIHIHVNFPTDHPSEHRHTLGILKRAWILAGFTEAFFYRIGGMGKEQRGKFMDYIYYRPILGNGPPIVCSAIDLQHRPVLNYDDVLKSKNQIEFFYKCGDIWNAESRYHPCRYFWINFYNLRTDKPHIEFRVFNKTTRWDYVYAIAELCKAFVRVCYTIDTQTLLKETKGSLFGLNACYEMDWEEYYPRAIKILRITDETVLALLRSLWDKTPIPYFDDMPVYSHITRSNIFHEKHVLEIFPKPLSDKEKKKVRYATYIDVHKLTEMGEYIFPEEDDGCVN
jgi:hypothetical protein